MIVLVRGEDWVGLYKEGNLLTENHSLSIDEVLTALGIEHDVLWADDEWLNERGWLPNKLTNVVLQ